MTFNWVMSWFLDASHCLGLIDLEACYLPVKESASANDGGTALENLLRSPIDPKSRIQSTPCLRGVGFRCGWGDAPEPRKSVGVVGNQSNVRLGQARSCESFPSTGAGFSLLPEPSCDLAGSAQRLDCSVHYSKDSPHPPISHVDTSEGVFLAARGTLVNRLCGVSSSGSPVIADYPTKIQRKSRHFLRNKRRIRLSDPLLRPPSTMGDTRSKSEHNLRRPSSFLSSGLPIRWSRSRSEWSLWAKDIVNGLKNSNDTLDQRISHVSDDAELSQSESEVEFLECSSEPYDQAAPLPSLPQLSEDYKYQRCIRRTCSDIGGNLLRQGRATDLLQQYGRQYSSPQPIKVRPLNKLPDYSPTSTNSNRSNFTRLKRSKGSAHLRRSVSQPLDLDKSFENHIPFLNNFNIGNEESSRKQRRPSVGNLLSEENTSEEDAELSDLEDQQKDSKRCSEEVDAIVYAEALWDHVSLDADELVFRAGDLITVVDSSDKDWWWGRISSRIGWFPSVFVRLLVNQEDHQQKLDSVSADSIWANRKLSLSTISHDQIRANVINEIISTERDFVKHLKDVVEGYLRQVHKRPDMFSKECISTIFGSLEELYGFQSHFLEQLEKCIDYDEPYKSCIGECFIRNRAKFEIYSEYCNNHPSAVSQLQQLYRQQKYVHFFEACRLLQEMIDISLDGFLLTPVQKICKYPLQLQELLKYTKPSHLDYIMVQGATQAMKEVALLVNERKRRMECLEKIASWQMAVEGWEGPDLLDDSSQLIYQGELTKGVGGPWPKEVILFLFDHQAVYCKRDLLKRSTYVYRGRINTDLCEVIDIPDGKDPQKLATVFYSWKIHCLDKNKTYVFACKSAQEKEKWLTSFKKERELVACDEEAGFVVSEKQKHVAKLSAKSSKGRPKKPRTKKPHKRGQLMTFAQAQLLVNTEIESESRSNSLPSGAQPPDPKKKGAWFNFGGNRKSKQSFNGGVAV